MRHCIVLFLVLVSLCATAQELSVTASPRPASAVTGSFRDAGMPTTLCAVRAQSAYLQALAPEERQNAVIDLVVDERAGNGVRASVQEVKRKWNAGDHDGAIADLAALESVLPASSVDVGISWRSSAPAAIRGIAGTDVRVGTRDSIVWVGLDYDPGNGNLIAVLHVRKSTGDSWTLNLSTDGGETWSEKEHWNATYPLNRVSLTILKGNAYVAFTRGILQDQILVYRYSTATGASVTWPGTPGYLTTAVTTGGGEKFTDLATTTNDGTAFRDRYYVSTITSTKKLRFFWYQIDSTSARETTTGVTSALTGLSCTYGIPGPYMWISYVDTAGQVCIDSIQGSNYARAYKYAGAFEAMETSISSQNDTIFCAFDFITSFVQTQYVIRYGVGSTWRFGAFADTSLGSEAPSATLRGGGGIAVAYRYYNSTRTTRVAWRSYPLGSTWSGNTVVSDHEPYPGVKPGIAYMGNKKYGVLYPSWVSPFSRAAYFDVFDATATGVEEQLTAPVRFALEQNYPNPFNPSTTIRYSLPERSPVSVKVFDALGREVAELVRGEQVAGVHEARFDGANLASGVYYCRMQAGNFSDTRKLLLMK